MSHSIKGTSPKTRNVAISYHNKYRISISQWARSRANYLVVSSEVQISGVRRLIHFLWLIVISYDLKQRGFEVVRSVHNKIGQKIVLMGCALDQKLRFAFSFTPLWGFDFLQIFRGFEFIADSDAHLFEYSTILTFQEVLGWSLFHSEVRLPDTCGIDPFQIFKTFDCHSTHLFELWAVLVLDINHSNIL